MKKIGILTFYKTLNYGALLQMYALYTWLTNNNYECEVIRYQSESITKSELCFLYKDLSIKQKIKNILMHNVWKNNFNKFNNFVKNNIIMSDLHYDKRNLKKINNYYDKIIVGSDQVWNLELTNQDYTYFLDFCDKSVKRLSYSASFGFEQLPNKYKNKVKDLLAKFDFLNVREESGKKIIYELLPSNKVATTIDPTLLLTKSEWLHLVNNDRKYKNYILVYLPNKSKETFDSIKKFAKLKKCKIIYIHRSVFFKFGVKNLKSPSPIEFLNLVNNAEYVITGSFHALCFSIIFNKKFFYTISPIKNRNTRLENMADKFNFKDRAFNQENYIADKIINYEKINELIERYRKESVNVINKMLRDDV